MPYLAWLREVAASARSQRVSSIMTLLFVLGSTSMVLITAGRAAGAEAAVLADIDAVGTRTLTVRVSRQDDEFNARLVGRLVQHDDVIEEITAFGPLTDVTAVGSGGTPVAMRTVHGSLAGSPLSPLARVAGTPQALASSRAITTLGLLAGRGSVQDGHGIETLVTGRVVLPEHLTWMEPVVLIPGGSETDEPLSLITVVAGQPEDLPLVTELVASELTGVQPESITLETSERLAELRGVIDGQLTRQGRSLLLGILVASAFATFVNVLSVALMRRRDFGRRRALGATRTMIVALLTAQIAVISSVGAVAGVAVGMTVVIATGDPMPTPTYLAAVAAAFITTATASAILPAVWAANRDPLAELRVP